MKVRSSACRRADSRVVNSPPRPPWCRMGACEVSEPLPDLEVSPGLSSDALEQEVGPQASRR